MNITLRELMNQERVNCDADEASTSSASCNYFRNAPLAQHSVGDSDPLDLVVCLPAISNFKDDPLYLPG